jgi:hypothetical protein
MSASPHPPQANGRTESRGGILVAQRARGLTYSKCRRVPAKTATLHAGPSFKEVAIRATGQRHDTSHKFALILVE